jgi:hypothetical protein
MKHFRFNVRCIDGRLFRHVPQHDDPDFEIDAGCCEDCKGAGCDRLHREAAEASVGDKIRTNYFRVPGPAPEFDWSASRDNDEPNDNGQMTIGYGRTEQDAIDDLVSLFEDERPPMPSRAEIMAKFDAAIGAVRAAVEGEILL